MTSLKDAHLVLFLTEGASLADWQRRGLLSREAELYLRLKPHLASISWVSYGGKADLAYQEMLPDIEILYNRYRLPNQVYIQQMAWLHRAAFQRATVLKSEQTGAAGAALAVARHYGKRYIARSGFSLALFAQYEPDQYGESYDGILALERASFQAAQQIVVTTEEMRQSALHLHSIPPDKICIIPNYVNTARFCPPSTPIQTAKPYVVFVGRLVKQKNVENLLSAVAPLTHIQVDIIGDGELKPILAERIERDRLHHVRLIGSLPNDELVKYFQMATIYAQPSRYEGHPKTIFEAMACATPVLVGDAPGIRQFIRHGETGWLCAEDPASIRAGLETLLADAKLRAKLGNAARAYVQAHFSLDAVVQLELEMLENVLRQPAPPAQPQPRSLLRSAWTYAARVGRLLGKRLLEQRRE